MANVRIPPFTEAPETVVGGTPQSVFPFEFPFWSTDDILVYVDGVLIEPAEYTVAGLAIQSSEAVEGGFGSGTVTFDVAVSDCTVTIDRDVVGDRQTQFSRSIPLDMRALNGDMNRLTARQQDLDRHKVTRPFGDRAGLYLAFDADGNEVASSGTGVDSSLRTDLAASAGGTLLGWIGEGIGAVARTITAKLRGYPDVKDFGAVGDAVVGADGLLVSGTDDSVAIQAALTAAKAAGRGSIFFPRGKYLCNTPLTMDTGVTIKGAGRFCTFIIKDSTTTKAVTVTAGAMTGGYTGTLPSSPNAILILTGDDLAGRNAGGVEDITLQGTYATIGDWESQKTEFGIVSIGEVSDFHCIRTDIRNVQRAGVLPSIFQSKFDHLRVENCLYGLFLNTGTSTDLNKVYANNCRDFGIWHQGMKYADVRSCAVDYLNSPDFYPDRTRECSAYVFNSSRSVTVTNNGCEQVYGNCYVFDDFSRSHAEWNAAYGLGSDYTGAEEIAVVKVKTALRGSTIANFYGVGVKAAGLIIGSADAAKHHNTYVVPGTVVTDVEKFSGILMVASLSDTAEAGYGNNVPTTWPNLTRSGGLLETHSPTFGPVTTGDFAVTYGAANKHYKERNGNLMRFAGCFDVAITHSTASGLVCFFGMPINGGTDECLGVKGIETGVSLTNLPAHFLVTAGSGTAIGRTPYGASLVIGDLPSGSYKIFYEGEYTVA